jgi:hypothetical protein
MRIGFPFPLSSNYLYNSSKDEIEWDMTKPFIVDSFPLKGMITRQWHNDNLLQGIEMSSAGFKGHEGSPLFDENGFILGMHISNSNYESNDSNNYPKAVFGNSITSNIITQFLLENGIKFYQMEDGKEVIYNENSKSFSIPKPPVPTFYLSGENESSIQVSQVYMEIDNKIMVDYNEPFKVAINKMDSNSKKEGVALVQFSTDGENEIFITEENAGSVSYLEKNNNHQLKVMKKEAKSNNWKVRASGRVGKGIST